MIEQTFESTAETLAAKALCNADWADLRRAVDALEHPSLAARLTSLIGTPVEEGLKLLPPDWHQRVSTTTEAVVHRILDVAVSTLPSVDGERLPDDRRHRQLGMATGALGGLFGLPGTLIELPFTTMLMMRSIAAIAKEEGEDLRTLDARLSCVEVFALGGPPATDDAAETGYFGLRMAMAYHFSTASEIVARHGIAARELPGVVALVRAVAARFGIVISDKAAFSLVPVAGAVSGALLNAIFMEHFQRMAHGHFIVRRLERRYGKETIETAYRSLASRPVGSSTSAAR